MALVDLQQDSTRLVVEGDSTAAWVMVLATVVLVAVTAWYARLTHRIAASSERSAIAAEKSAAAADRVVELEHDRERLRRERLKSRLQALSIQCSWVLTELERTEGRGDRLRSVALWDPNAPSQIKEFATELDHHAGHAIVAEQSLRWLGEQVRAFQTVPKYSRESSPAIDRDRFMSEVQSAIEQLEHVGSGLEN